VSDYSTADYEPSQRGTFLELMHDAWGERSMTDEEFDWWFERNPTGEHLIAVALDNDEVIGVAGTSCFLMQLDRKREIGTFSVHATTRADARSRGVFQRLELHNEERSRRLGAACVLAFASAPTIPIFLQRLDWREVGLLRAWARVLRPSAAFRRRGGRALASGAGLRSPSGEPRGYGKIAVVPLTRFGPSTDALYERAASAWGNHVVRSAEHMNWRYLDSPWDYRAFAAIADGEPCGYTIVRFKDHRGIPLGVIADLVSDASSFSVTRALLRRAIEELKGCVDAVVALPPANRAQRRAFLSLGFLPSPIGLHFMGASLRDDFDLPLERSAWHFSLGDTDFF
jgi:hypothetical protein